MTELETGTRIGRYTLVDLIGRTGMSEVWRAKDWDEKIVALKTISSRAVEDPQLRVRFLREGGEHQQLSHPAIVPILDFLEQEGGFYLVMQYLADGSLEDHLEKIGWGPLPIPRALRIASQILPALDFAHQRLIIHRDVKPSNILLEGDRAYLSDFGIALALSRPRLTTYSQILGTRCYMSPEQILMPLEITHLTDVYSFGCVMYELLTGRQPFDQGEESPENQYAMMDRRLREPPVPLREWNPEIPQRLEQIVLTSLAPLPNDRFAGCGSFARALEAVERAMADSAPKIVIPPPAIPSASTASAQADLGPPPIPFKTPASPPSRAPDLDRSAPPPDPVKPVEPPTFQTSPKKPIPAVQFVSAALIIGLGWLPFAPQAANGAITVTAVASSILLLTVLYRGWSALPAGYRRTTPANAVGLLLLPLFNLYWVWNVIPGFARDYNEYLRKEGLRQRPQPLGFYAFFCIFCYYLPCLVALLGAPVLVREITVFDMIVLVPVMIGLIASAVNNLPSVAMPRTAASAREHSNR